MSIELLAHMASIDIAAQPEVVYDLVSDLPRMGEWSPENNGGNWMQGEPARVGATFDGHNSMEMGGKTMEWNTRSEVTIANEGSCFEFVVGPHDSEESNVRWTYCMEASGSGGTTLTEQFAVTNMPAPLAGASEEQLKGRQMMVAQGMEATLANIKTAAEAA